ncbi:MAG TPA: hypothetical protein PLP66_07090 [Phycisphaerae bacterium]|nr:hypothetical protein [Phycisphaerae bacterium]
MSQMDTLYAWLAADPRPEADETLVAALERAEPAYASRIIATLLARATETAWIGLVFHYDRLDHATRRQLRTRPPLLRTGIAGALQSRAPRARLNALTLLTEQPSTPLLFMVADALRDPVAEVRAAAARVLCLAAERVLGHAEGAQRTDVLSPQAAAERTALVSALREGLRTFDLHAQMDVLKVCFWLARDIGPALWTFLAPTNNRWNPVVARRLQTWNGPRLAGFLLLALAQPGWRQTALALLRTWRTRADLLALLQHTDLLADAAVRQALRLIERPAWFVAAGPDLGDLPPQARVKVPQWIAHLGFTPAECVRWLRRWQQSPLPDVRRAAEQALAGLGSPVRGRRAAVEVT